jgi:hypothetical protein
VDPEWFYSRSETKIVPSKKNGNVADPGSDAFLTPGSGFRFCFFPDLGSMTS